MPLLSPFLMWGSWGTDWLSNVAKLTELVNRRAETEAFVVSISPLGYIYIPLVLMVTKSCYCHCHYLPQIFCSL